ncbi:MAG TPA: UPF0149 family protein [Arenimonas sp.]|nr:UPF0149 family protein [Arenimonas sp.]
MSEPQPVSAEISPFATDDPRIEALDRLLELRAVPHGGMDLEQLDGFLSALVVGPDSVPPSEWQPRVWGKTPPRWESPEDAAEAQGLLMGLWNTIAKRVRYSGESMPMDCLMFWWLPENPEGEHPDEVDIGAGWGEGFLHGMELCDAGWDRWVEDAAWIGDIEAHIESLATGEIQYEGEDLPHRISYRERLELFAGLMDMLHDLHCYRIEQMGPRAPVRVDELPGRNDPCPCGSGKKFKKCCGSAERLH